MLRRGNSEIVGQRLGRLGTAVDVVRCTAKSSLLFFFLACNGWSDAAENASRPAFPTGTHLQLVRTFYDTADGLPSQDIRAVTVTRSGAVFVADGYDVARLDGERWVKETGPADVAALFAPTQGPEALAGATNGVWGFANHSWEHEAGSPEGAIAFAAEPDGTPWALAPSGVWRRANGWTRVHTVEDDQMFGPRDLLPTGPDDVLVASETGLYGLMGKRKYWLAFEIRPGGFLSASTQAVERLDRDHFLVVTDKGLNLSNGKRGWHSFSGKEGLPILDLTGVAVAPDGSVWLGSDEGIIHWTGTRWTYLAGQRWLPDNRVTAMAPARDGSIWVGTQAGLAHLNHRKLTLEEKAAHYQEQFESRSRRHGYVGEMQLAEAGVLEGAQQEISDNDGLRTALYIAAQSYRYAVTAAPEAKAQAWRSMQSLLRLETITGISGFPARAICHVDEPQFAQRSLRSSSEWHESPVEKDWYWKGETSSDELDGHYFGWYVFYELAANDDEKLAVRAVVKRVTDHILDHGYYLVDIDGKPTTWGVWAPEKLNDDPIWWPERGLNSLEILSHLKVAHHIVADPRYERAYNELIQKHNYAINTLHAKVPGAVSHDDQLLFLSYYPLLQLEKEPGLRAIFTSSLKRTWQPERVEGNPLWNFIYGASTREPCDAEAAVESLREMPLDLIIWKIRNSHRADLKFDPVLQRQGIKQLVAPLSWTERVIHKWDKNPYVLDGGSDLGEGDPTIWLLPYWMGRYHKIIE
ncbi:MAG: hypothetical protein L0228_06115 [Planctomycetes bacterium]|nr:hypothetical protein [Planctomycetota bacterium]